MDEAGIDKEVLSYPTTDAHLKLGASRVISVYNQSVSEIERRYPDRFIGAALVYAGADTDPLRELKKAQNLGYKAVSLATSYEGRYLDDALFLPVWEHAEKQKICVFVHSQIINPIGFERVNDPLLTPVIEYVFDTTICIGKMMMSGIFMRFKGVKFIFANFGGAITHLAQRFDATYTMLRGINFVKDLGELPADLLKNIYVDSGGDRNRLNFDAALEFLGAGRLFWGSDWPAKKDAGSSIKLVKDLDITEEEKKGILGNNLAQILNV
jgi:predicted TIM-barrel fold metal-dependent hydrolase